MGTMSKRTSLGDHRQATTAADVPERKHLETKQSVKSKTKKTPVTMSDIDGWHARDLIAPLFFNDNTDLHSLIRKRLILPYLLLNWLFSPIFY